MIVSPLPSRHTPPAMKVLLSPMPANVPKLRSNCPLMTIRLTVSWLVTQLLLTLPVMPFPMIPASKPVQSAMMACMREIAPLMSQWKL